MCPSVRYSAGDLMHSLPLPGQKQPSDGSENQLFKRLVGAETSRTPYDCKSVAFANVRLIDGIR
jgi:hypothetical protein